MLSARVRAHLGLFAVALVLIGSMAVLLKGHASLQAQSALHHSALQAQVVISDSPTLVSQR